MSKVKVKQIQLQQSTGAIYGLGDDGQMYRWQSKGWMPL